MANDNAFTLRREPVLDAKHEAFAYQEEAVQFVAARSYSAIFHEQGLGKTKIAVDVILTWLREHAVDTVLVVTKKGLIANWVREFSVHSHLAPLVLSEDSARNYYVFTTPARIVLCHYEVARKEENRLGAWLRSRRVAIIIDEAAKLKNPDAELTKVFFRLSQMFARRVIMTGTPVANRPYDIWAQIFFLDNGAALGTDFKEFKSETDFDATYAKDPASFIAFQRRLSEINEKLESFSVRETKDGGRISLPSKEYLRVECNWEAGQFELYRQVREELSATVVRDGVLVAEDHESVLKRLLRLVQIASNPRLVDEQYDIEPGKFSTLYDLISDITSKGEKAIIWTAFNDNCEWLAKKLSSFGAHALNGRLSMDRRNSVVNWFMENESDQVLVATPGAAKEGLTLTVANHVIFYDRTYSLDDYLQAQDRIHRVSQTRKCYVYNFIMVDSVDEWVDALLEEKRLAAQLTQGDIDIASYSSKATLSFFEILKRILA
jgi:SNF2 family DNA or RNA helicase